MSKLLSTDGDNDDHDNNAEAMTIVLRTFIRANKKSRKTQIFTLPHIQGHVTSVKCEQPLDELQSKFGYCMTTRTLNIAL